MSVIIISSYPDRWKQTPLAEAYKNKHEAVAEFIHNYCAPKENSHDQDEVVFKAVYTAAMGDVDTLRSYVNRQNQCIFIAI